jgi:hypothetical protein
MNTPGAVARYLHGVGATFMNWIWRIVTRRWAAIVRVVMMPTRRHWYESFGWLLATVLGGLMPLWGSYILFLLKGKTPQLNEFVIHGEFALYSAAMLAAACFLIMREWPSGYFPWRIIFGMSAVAGVVLSALVFASVFEANLTATSAATIDVDFLRPFSLVLFSAAFVLSYVVTLIDLVGFTIDPQELQAEEDADLASQFHALEDQQ